VRVLLAGGGSGGSATPILAVATELRAREPGVELLFLGTHDGPEATLAAEQGIRYVGVSTGKLRRYWDTQNVVDVGRITLGVGQSLNVVRRFRPDVAFGAGGFASVPPLAAAGLLRTPVLIHQQDVVPGLANRLLVPFAARITVAMPDTVASFPRGRTVLRGNPVRPRILEGRRDEAVRLLGLEPDLPLLLVTGGGTGALGLNRLVAAAAPALVERCQTVHLTGRGRRVPAADVGSRYRQIEFLVEEMPHLLAGADLVITRAGMGTLSELAAVRKPAIVIPLPGSHQEANARAFGAAGAAVAVNQDSLTAESLASLVLGLLDDAARRRELGVTIGAFMPPDAASTVASDVLSLARSRP
jgi:UDP-N-acetylglucosamine--N-acetylmuramyl-(pentapeptide) pyrophosphoryl-undecaprenol N-acetylglucosamine transferase